MILTGRVRLERGSGIYTRRHNRKASSQSVSDLEPLSVQPLFELVDDDDDFLRTAVAPTQRSERIGQIQTL